jgi:hypothetical protein
VDVVQLKRGILPYWGNDSECYTSVTKCDKLDVSEAPEKSTIFHGLQSEGVWLGGAIPGTRTHP